MKKTHKTLDRPQSVAVIVYVRNQGRLLHYTLMSVFRSIDDATQHGISVDVVIVADKPGPHTKIYLEGFGGTEKYNVSVAYKDHGDVGKSYNDAAKNTNAEALCLMLAGDLISKNWISQAYSQLSLHSNLILHPEYCLLFDGKDELWEVVGSTSARFDARPMIEHDMFPPLAVLSKTTYLRCQFNAAGLSSFWSWNADTLANHVPHGTVSGSMCALRAINDNNTVIIPRSSFFVNTPQEAQAQAPASEVPAQSQTRRAIRSAVERLYQCRASRKIQHKYPRLETYFTSMRNETLHLLRDKEVPRPDIFPDWLSSEIQQLHAIDLAIFLSGQLRKTIENNSRKPGIFTDAYWEIVADLPANLDLLVLMPYIKNGGAEREVSYMLSAYLAHTPDAKVAIITTDLGDSPWAKNIDARVKVIVPPASFHQLTTDAQSRLIASLLIWWKPKKLHVINSLITYRALAAHHEEINQNTKIFITIFSIDKTPEGRNTHMFTQYMIDAVDSVEKIFTDNMTVTNQLVQIMAVPADKFSVHYQPVDQTNITKRIPYAKKEVTKILWAGRLDRQKRPDILLRVADQAKQLNLPVELHVYGSSAFADNTYLDQVSSHDTVRYHGAYEGGLKSLPLQEYDAFLMTSEWEGMPNVLLEAIVGGLLVIAPNVGGVAELIKNKDTGMLIDKFDDVNAYTNALGAVIADPKGTLKIIAKAQKLIKSRHSQHQFVEELKREKEYIN